MRRWALPLGAAAALVLGGAGLWWLMHHDLRLAFYAALVAAVGLLVAAVLLWRRGHRRTPTALVATLVLALVAIGGFAWNLNATLGELPTVPTPSGWGDGHPEKETGALNILLLGADNPTPQEDKPTVAELLADGTWDVGAYRSDSLMLVHIAEDRRQASVVSIPRDSYVPIYDAEDNRHEQNKINAAFSSYGPFGTVRTVEHLTGLHVDHMAIIDFEGFRDLTTAIGGVDVFVPETIVDPQQDVTWPQGWNHIEGSDALKYVRMRYGFQNGDFDRVARQQNFLRAVVAKLTDEGTLGDPVKLRNVLKAVVGFLTVDETWTTGDIRSLGWALRTLHQEDIDYATLPLDHYETIDGVGSANIIDAARARELWKAVQGDRLGAYLTKYPDDALADEQSVS